MTIKGQCRMYDGHILHLQFQGEQYNRSYGAAFDVKIPFNVEATINALPRKAISLASDKKYAEVDVDVLDGKVILLHNGDYIGHADGCQDLNAYVFKRIEGVEIKSILPEPTEEKMEPPVVEEPEPKPKRPRKKAVNDAATDKAMTKLEAIRALLESLK